MKYDFSGWATRNDLKCSDGRTIRSGAFKDCDGIEVPLVWNHSHNEPDNVLGHALLQNRDSGVYCYGVFNDTSSGQVAKTLVEHGDIKALSIYANQLKQLGGDVVHGTIREVSLVHAGANPGAYIDTIIAHSDECDEEAVIYTGEDFELYHSDEKKEEDNKMANENASNDKTIKDVFDTLTEEQKTVVYALIGMAVDEAKNGNSNENEEDDDDMSHNVFENDMYNGNVDALMHSAMDEIINDGKRFGSLKESFMQHAADYGIEQIDWLFPEAQNVNGDTPGFIKRTPDGWVKTVLNGVKHTPFARIKMMFADIREDDARAKGYAQKGKLKKEEVFGLLKRTVEPTTIYKKQKLDRDDVVDITDFDVVSWIKGEMRTMLDEEIARAILFGDGRPMASEDKIRETNIIPIASDNALFTITSRLDSSDTNIPHAIITAVLKGQDSYEGSGNTTFYTTNEYVTKMLLMEDTLGHRMYKDVHELALAMSVNKIEKVPSTIMPSGIYGVVVDLNDYNVGADKGGAVNMFDDFDIDYNQQKYLIETRCSGALVKPFSAIVIKPAE